MLTVGYLLNEIEAAIARGLPARRAYAMEEGFEIAAPLLPEDPEDAHERVSCALIEQAKMQGGMLRFSLTEEAICSVLPDDGALCAMERAHEELLDALFAGDLPHGAESAALAYARLCIILRKPPLESGGTRELLWISAQAFSGRPLAAKKLLRALKPYISDLSINPNPTLRYCRAALGEILNK